MSKELNHLYKLQQEEQNHLQLLRDTKKQIENGSDFQTMLRIGSVNVADAFC
jgi:hypothetical protein